MPKGSNNANKTECIHGHEYTPENTYWVPGKTPEHAERRNCVTCRRRRGTEWQQRNPDHIRRKHLKTRYGITPEQFEEMSIGGCDLCGKVHASGGVLHVDHCHDTGRVRGVLCSACNSGLHTVEKMGIDAVAAYLIS
tara:strand:- start:1590 stop:2000 length:411 start_codon:yes stop_codon:yes gene_type:complete